MFHPYPDSHLQIRDLVAGDQTALTELFGRLAGDSETARYFHPFPLTLKTARQLCSRSDPALRDVYLLALVHDQPLGFGMLRGWDAGFAAPSFGACVAPQARDAGLGKALLAHAIARARSMGAPMLLLSVYRENARAVHLYRQFGFEFEEKSRREWQGTLDLTQPVGNMPAISMNWERLTSCCRASSGCSRV